MGKCCSEKETAHKEKNKGTSLKAHKAELHWETEDLTMQHSFANPKRQMMAVFMVVVFSRQWQAIAYWASVVLCEYRIILVANNKTQVTEQQYFKVSTSNQIQTEFLYLFFLFLSKCELFLSILRWLLKCFDLNVLLCGCYVLKTMLFYVPKFST